MSEPAAPRLEHRRGRLALCFADRPAWGAISADWLGPEQRRRVQAGRRQLLGKALGLARRPDSVIVDATAGFGRDGFTLAALGACVTLIERQPQIAALLRDAWERACAAEDAALRAAARRCRIVEADAARWLRAPEAVPDAVHLDPMYPEDGKTALPQKTLQAIRELAGTDPDADALLAAALGSGARRVAVKRPSKAPWLAGRKPDLVYEGTQARYDVYLPQA